MTALMIDPMATSTLLPAFLLLFSALAAGLWFARQRRARAADTLNLHEALSCCDCLMRLLSNLQQHRGLSSGWLAGDKSFEGRMLGKRGDIEALFGELTPFVARECAQTRPCLTSHDLMLFRFKWRSLVDELARGNVEQNIAQHSHLISTVLDWLAALGEARIELCGGDCLAPGLVRNYAHRLPALSECLGQARAIGSSVAARHACPAVARVRLMFLIARSESLLDQACAAGDPGSLGGRAKSAVGVMATTVRMDMLAASGVTLSADAYFALSTRAVDAVLEWARDCGSRINRDLSGKAGALPAGLGILH